ncbi:CaiF/GrlA family transcriptional regulator [Serratia bockelmannii]|uniref:CaiF/GrlA family transcriptional regulator n=1 Tax=Serratia bockelmannii TaxID=2703793 RepID=UPI00235E1695|nr:CaiF/GrlA family transcriptional regulator [Serratia bockelmannii]
MQKKRKTLADVTPGTASTTGARIPPAQSNWGGFTLPGSLAHLAGEPFYRVVALWAWESGITLCAAAVSAMFCIEMRRAHDVIRYLRTDRSGVTLAMVRGGGVRFQVLAVAPLSLPTCDTSTRRAVLKQKAALHDDIRALRRWFLTSALNGRPDGAGD